MQLNKRQAEVLLDMLTEIMEIIEFLKIFVEDKADIHKIEDKQDKILSIHQMRELMGLPPVKRGK